MLLKKNGQEWFNFQKINEIKIEPIFLLKKKNLLKIYWFQRKKNYFTECICVLALECFVKYCDLVKSIT